MAVAGASLGFTSEVLVNDMHSRMRQDLAQAEISDSVRVDFALIQTDPPALSYGAEVLNQTADNPRLSPVLWVPDKAGSLQPVTDIEALRAIRREGVHNVAGETALRECIERANSQKDSVVDGLLVLSSESPEHRDLYAAVASAIDPEIDLDGSNPDSSYIAATADGMATTADYKLQAEFGISLSELESEEVVVLGGGNVAGPLVTDILPKQYGIHVPPENHYAHLANLEPGAKRLATDQKVTAAFTASRMPAHIKELTPNTVLVDVGNAINPQTGKSGGNAHPDLLARNGEDGKFTSAFRGCSGRVTIATVILRGVQRGIERNQAFANV